MFSLFSRCRRSLGFAAVALLAAVAMPLGTPFAPGRQVTGSDGAAAQGLCHVPPSTYTQGRCPFGAWTQIPGNVSLIYDQDIQFTGDAFVHLGAAGLALGDGTQRALKGNVVTDVSGSGIEIGNVDLPTATGSAQTADNGATYETIKGNAVYDNTSAQARAHVRAPPRQPCATPWR